MGNNRKVRLYAITAGAAIGSLFYGVLFDRYQIIKNKIVTRVENRAKILINWDISQEAFALLFGLRGQIAKFFSEKKIRADWVYNAFSNDLVEVLNDKDYQSIAIVGHGDTHGWFARDGVVRYDTLESRITNERKNGFWLHIVCAVSNKIPLGIHFMENKYNVLGYCGDASPLDRKIKDMQAMCLFYPN